MLHAGVLLGMHTVLSSSAAFQQAQQQSKQTASIALLHAPCLTKPRGVVGAFKFRRVQLLPRLGLPAANFEVTAM
jgi:hypothetical protein